MKNIAIAVLALIFSNAIHGAAAADVPDLLPVQGLLTDTDGNPIDEPTDITFTLYDDKTGTNALWTDTFADVDVVDGFFTVYMGTNKALNFASLITNAEIWLGMAVESDSEMERFQLSSVPFAVQAQVCERVGTLTEDAINTKFSVADHGHTDVHYTKTEMSTSGNATLHWDNVSDKPEGFSDGTDDNTTYSGKDFATSGQTCPAGQRVNGIDADGKITCASIAPTCRTVVQTFSGDDGVASCLSSEKVTGGGFWITDGERNDLNWNTAASYPKNNGYVCNRSVHDTTNSYCYAICCTFPE